MPLLFSRIDPYGISVSRLQAWGMACLLLAGMWLWPRQPFEDCVVPIGDTLDYQVIAVNFAKVNVFPSDAMVLPDSTYHFDVHLPSDTRRIAERGQASAHHYNFVRNPLYTFFCGMVYKAFGIHPRILFFFQFIILILALALLPVIGAGMAGYRGLWSGAATAIAIFLLNKYFATEVQTQALVLPYTIGLWWLLSRHLGQNSAGSMMTLGIYLGLGLLLKNFFIPIAFITVAYYFWFHSSLRSLLFPLVIILTIAPWTFCANRLAGASEDFFVLTTQGDDVLLASNNDAATDGDWHPEGVAQTRHYQLAPSAARSAATQVLGYWIAHPLHTVTMISEKIRLGLLTRWPPVLFLALLLTFSVIIVIPTRWRCISVTIALLAISGAILYYVFDRAGFYTFQRTIDGWLYVTRLPLLVFIVAIAIAMYLSRYAVLKFPPASIILMVGFILLDLIFYGSPRIVGMIDFLWMFYAAILVFDMRDLLIE